MANGANIVVPVGVQLELNNVQDIIGSLQKAMSNVKPDTKGYSSIVSELSKAEKRADALASKLKQGFTTNAGIQSFTKGFEDLIAMVDTINGKVGQISFDNLTLTADQQAKMESFAKQIEAAKNAYNAIETSKIQEVVKNSKELKTNFDNLKINPDTTSLDKAIKTIKEKVDELQKDIDNNEKKAVGKETLAARRQDEYKQLKSLRDSLKKGNLTQDFSQFFNKNGDFKSNGKQAFIRLLEQLGLDEATVDKVKRTAGTKIKEIQEELDKAIEAAQKKKNKSRIDAQNAANEARADIAAKIKEQSSYRTSQSELEAVQKTPEIVKAEKEKQDAIQKTNEERQKAQDLITQGAKGKAGTESADELSAALNRVREAGGAAAAELANLDQRTKTVNGIKNAISMWMGFNQVLRLSRTAIRNMVKDIRDLDKVMTEIAVVTNMSQKDLWNQMNTYQGIAKQYGVATTGVYQVSQIYYQQGLQTSEVMNLTNETLKMAKIAGLDYGAAADYMTVAIRGFKMEMTDAQKVVDVYSNLAAKSASDTTELATAMSKTASSAAAVGSSFENTSAMIAMMVETTRESAENIGSALKSIISRYGEMTSDPSKLVDSEGEALSLNKVDKALQSVGISLHNAQGQFRDFDEVILELSSKWDTLDKNSQRYVATVMAGNRQQSRFLALVSDYSRLSELTEEAANSEDAALVQTLKTMDSLETKIQNVKNAFQGFYGNLGLESVFKGALDAITSIINQLNAMPKAFGKIPIAAIGMVANIINVIKTLGTTLISVAATQWTRISKMIEENIAKGWEKGNKRGVENTKAAGNKIKDSGAPNQNKKRKGGMWAAGTALNTIGAGLSTWALTMKDSEATTRGTIQSIGGLTSGIGSLVTSMATIPGPAGVILGLISAISSGLPGLISGLHDLQHAEELQISAARKAAEQANQEATLAKSEAKNLENVVDKLEKLNEAKNDSNEAYQEWIDYVNQVANNYPQLISAYDAENNAVLDMAEAYSLLAKSRSEASKKAKEARKADLESKNLERAYVNQVFTNMSDPKYANKMGDDWGSGLQNLLGSVNNSNGQIQLSFAEAFGGQRQTGDLSKYLEVADEGNGSHKIKLKTDSLDNFLQDYADQKFENAPDDLMGMVDLFYDILIRPLSSMEFANDTRFDNDYIKKQLASIKELDFNSEVERQQAIIKVYVTALQDIQKYARQNVEDEAELAKINEELAISEEDFTTALEERINEAKNNKATEEEISKLTDIQNSKFLQALFNDLRQRGILDTDESEKDYLNKLVEFYSSLGEESQKAITEILANSEKYSSKDSLMQELNKYINFNNLDSELNTSIINYVNDFWEKTNKKLQDSFKTNIESSQKKNDTIQKASQKLSFIGDGITEFDGEKYSEIAAQYLNDINKQWSDLVTNQKNEAVATQNAKFLAETYTDVGQLSEDANGVMANILSTAELNTREGIQKAIDQIEQYQDTNDLKDEDKGKIAEIIKQLQEHKDNLLLNLNTELQQYTDSLSDAVKNVNQNYTNNTSGFGELKDANEALQKINSGKIGSKQLTFDEAFKFDENLGKYVFTVQGLMEANEAQMKEINSQYKDATEQLDFEKVFLTNAANTLKGFSTEDIIKGLTSASTKEGSKLSSEQQQIIGQIAKDFEDSGLKWDEFIENRLEELNKLGISAEQAKKAAENMTKEAQTRNAAKAIDFSGISTGAKKVLEARQELINYFITNIDNWEELTETQKEEYEKQAELFADETYQKISGGGRTAAEEYRKIAEEQNIFDPDTYNQILNQPGQAAKSLLDKLNNSIGQTSIQLTQEEVTLANELGIKNDGVSVIAGELRANAGKLVDSLSENLAQGNITLQEYNKQVAENNKTSGEKLIAKADELTTFLTSGAITVDSLSTLATSLGTKLKEDFSITELKGIKKNENGVNIVEDLDAFLESFNNIITSSIDVDAIKNALDLQDKSKITDAAIQAENSIIESIASEINTIKSAGIGKKVNLTYLTNKLGADNLKSIFGDAYQNGILTVTDAVKANMYNSLKEVRTSLKASGENTDELIAALMSYIDSAISDFSDFSGAFEVSDETAQLLASRSSIFEAQLAASGKIAIESIESFVNAANVIYSEVNGQYVQGLANLTKLNNAYSNIIKGNLAKQTAGFNMLTSASKIDLSSLQNFLNTYSEKLSKYVDRMGNLTSTGAEAGLKSLGNGNYQIADWHKFISQLQITANELSADYIDAYISWLQSDANVAPDAKEALMTSLVPNMEKLTYAQIGQIAKTFNMTVDQVLALVENNGDNTFNGSALLNTLDFDKHNQEFKQALTKQYSEITNNLTSALVSFVESGSDGKRTGLDFANLDKAVNDYTKAMHSLGENVEIDLYNLKMRLVLGGESAVAAGQEIAKFGGVELSAQDIETLYRGAITRYVNTIDTVVAKPGEIVDEATASIIKQAGGKVNELGTTGQYVVETAANLYEAYNDLLHRMAATGEATLADLNKVAALALENRDGEQQVIDALGDAAGMTFTRFGEILANAGIQLSENMVNDLEASGIIELMGGNKMKIIDFQAFADLMQWDANSEEYISAFKSYNDSLIEMNRQAERNILEEAESIADAKGGDWINLTQMYDKIFEPLQKQVVSVQQTGGNAPIITTAFDKLNRVLKGYGANLEDGILKLDDSANIPAIMQEIAKAAAESGSLLSNELAELADTVADVIKGYADLISGAISGSLSNTQAEQLQDWASTNGIGKLNFTETEDGLKVATDQAFELVAALRQVDSMQGKLTFDNLVDSLSADKDGRFENISKTTAEIGKLNTEYENNKTVIENLQKAREHADTNAKANIDKEIAGLEQKNSKLRDQIGLYQQIQQRQSIDPAQYNFMDRDLPDTMQGPINYWNSVGQAFSAMNESSKTGRMEIQDFYNIVNEMENLANTSGQVFDLAGYKIGGSASEAAKLIQNGMGALDNIDGKGVKVNLQNLGVDFASGADGAKKNFTDGVHALAESQVAMLDAAIQVLEVVVAMEKLGDIDVDSNNVFSIGDIFKLDDKGNPIPEYTAEFKQYATDLLDAAKTNEDLRKGLENFSINGISLKEMFEDATDGIKDLNISEEAYFAVMEAFVNAAKNGDYNLDTIQDSVWEILDKTLPDGSVIDMGDRSIVISGGTHTVIDWKSEDTKAAEKQLEDYAKKNNQTTKQALIDAFTKVQNGTSNQVQMEAVLTAKGLIKVDNETNEVEINGHKYKSINEAGAKKEIAELALTEVGANKDTIVSSTDAKGNITATGKVKVGQTELDVEYRDGKVIYKNDKGQEFNTVQALADQEIIDKVNDFKKQLRGLSQEDKKDAIAEYTKIVTAEVNYKYNLSTKVSLDGTEQQIRETLALGRAEIEKQIEEGKKSSNLGDDGKYHITLSSGLEVSGFGDDFNADSVIQEAISSLGIDGLIAGVSEGIKQAFASEDNVIGEAIASGITTALSNYTITIDNAGNIVFKPKGDDAEIDKPSAETAAETAAEKVTDLNISSVDAKITKLNITDVQDAGMGGSGLVNQLGKDLFGSKSFTIPSADAAVTKLTITSVTDSEYKAGDDAASPTIDSLDATITSLKISANDVDVESVKQQIIDALKETVEIPATVSTEDAITAINSVNDAIEEGKTKPINADSDKGGADGVISAVDTSIETSKTKPINADSDKGGADGVIKNVDANIEASKTKPINADSDKGGADGVIKAVDTSIETSKTKPVNADSDKGGADAVVDNLEKDIETTTTKPVNVNVTLPEIWDKLDDTVSKTVKVSAQKTGTWPNGVWPTSSVTGNVALSKGNLQGRAYSTGNTLMGELGPEMVVSHGRYFVVGQNGPEMVNLAEDAIVFNHLQTEQLLRHGKASGHAQPVTNERKATSLATGNVGPAMASASAALAALKQLRAMWQSLMNASLADLGGMPKGSGGGGGGGGGGSDKIKDAVEGINGEVERWYNWLKLIEATQNKINILTKEYDLLAARGVNTKDLANNLKEQAEQLQVQLDAAKQLSVEQTKYRTQVINTANNGLMGAFYNADPATGQVYLANDKAFINYAKEHGLDNKYLTGGKVAKGKKLKTNYTKTQINTLADQKYDELKSNKKLSKDEYKKLSKEDKKYYSQSGDNYVLKDEKTIKEQYKQESQSVEIFRKGGIKTGLDLMDELFGQKDKAGNNKHTAKEQLALIQAMGVYSEDLMAGVDTTQDDWEAQVVQNFKDKIESDKTEIEGLTQSIQEQKEAALEYAKAIQDINNQYHEMAKPVEAMTDHLEEWYEWTRKITTTQSKLNLLTTQYNTLTNRRGDTTKQQVKNLKQQAAQQLKMRDSTQKTLEEMQDKQADFKKSLEVQFLTKDEAKKINSINKTTNKQNAKKNQENTKLINNQKKANDKYNAQTKKDEGKAGKKLAKQTQKDNKKWNKDKNKVGEKNGKVLNKKTWEQLDKQDRKYYKKNKKGEYVLKDNKETNLKKLRDQVSDKDIETLNQKNQKWNKAKNAVGKKQGKTLNKKAWKNLTKEEKKYYKKGKNGKYVLKDNKKANYQTEIKSNKIEDIEIQLAEERNAKNQKWNTNKKAVGKKNGKTLSEKAWNKLSKKDQKYYQKNKKGQYVLKNNRKTDYVGGDFQNNLETTLKTDFAQSNNRNLWYDFDKDGNLIFNKTGLKKFIKANGSVGKKGFEVTDISERVGADGSFLRKVGKKTISKSDRDKALTDLGLSTDIDSEAFGALESKISEEDYKKMSKDFQSLYKKGKNGKYQLTKRVKNAQQLVTGYDNGVNILDTKTIIGNKKGTDLQKHLAELNASMNDPEKFFQKLTEEDAFDGRQQMEILEQMGLGDTIAKMGNYASWETMTEDERIDAAKEYLQKVKETPEEYNKLLDQINENKEQLEAYKNQVAEINNQIRELLEPVDGVTEHLEAWYEWTRKTATAQNELNKLTAIYANLEKGPGNNAVAQIQNLTQQAAQVQKKIDANTHEQKERKIELKKEKGKVEKGPMSNLFGFDENGNVVYKTSSLKGLTGTAVMEVLDYAKDGSEQRTINGKAMSYEAFKKSKKYDKLSKKEQEQVDAEWDLSTLATKETSINLDKFFKKANKDGVITPEEFIATLTETNDSGKAIHSLQEQRAVLEKAGFSDEMAEFYGKGTWDELNAAQRNEAAKEYLEYISQYPEKINQLKDSLAEAEVAGINLKGDLIDINAALIDITKRQDGVTNHLDKWYNLSRNIVKSQNELNLLTAKYNIISNKLGDNSAALTKNLQDQAKQTSIQLTNTTQERKAKETNLKTDRNNLLENMGMFFTQDGEGVSFANGSGLKSYVKKNKSKDATYNNGKISFNIEKSQLKLNADGTYQKDANGAYVYDEKHTTQKVSFDLNDPAKFIDTLTNVTNGVSDYSLTDQAQILTTMGFSKQIAELSGYQTLDGLSQEKLNTAVEKYINYLKEAPENINAAADEVANQIVEEKNLKAKILEINNQIRELSKPTAGVTEHLESWYNWTRKTVNAQQELNKLTARFSNLEKKPGDNTRAIAKNLSQQGEQYQNNIKANKEIIDLRREELNAERRKIKNNAALSKLLSFDSNKNLIYSEGAIGFKNQTISVNEIQRDSNGREIRADKDGNILKYGSKEYEQGIVQTVAKRYKLTGKGGIFEKALDENGKISPQKFIEILTDTDATGKAKLSLEQQQAVLEQIGITGKDLTQFGDFENWDEATAEQRKDAVANYLKAVPEAAERINGLKDEIVSLQVENINLEGNILDVNNQLKELSTIAAGIQNPFEQWHSWLQKIKQEQNQLNILTQKYSNLDKERVNNGTKIAANLRKQLKNLKQQQETNQKYLEARQTDYNDLINRSNWTKAQKKFFKVDKNGQLQYNNKEFEKQIENNKGIELTGGTDGNGVYNYRNIEETIDFSATGIEDFLDKLTKQNADNSMAYNADQQFAILKAFGFSDLMQFDSSGNPIFQNGIENATKEEREAAVKTVLDNLKGFQEKVESSADDLQELKEKGIELTGNVIDIKNQIQDNEIELENKILQAIEDREQKRIDDLKEQKDMLSEAADNFLNGLNEQLSKERDMYEKQESQDELTKLQRQLAILQRSGGSSSQIRSLQEQIKSQQKDMYFDERQDQIDAIKEASDKQIEKLDRQIQIAEETLAFNKENGLYWKEVREIMKLDSNKILSFIETNLAERNSQSTLQADLAITDDGKIVGTYTGTRGMAFKTGGLADYTGPAWLDGTKNKPESVLNAEQTSFLRNKLIDNLESFSLAISQFTNGTLSNNILGGLGENAGINIEQLDFVMKVDSLANDYDAKRAGQQAFDEMVRIARKAGNRSISRR